MSAGTIADERSDAAVVEPESDVRSHTRLWQRLARRPLSLTCIAYLVLLFVLAIGAPLVAPYDPFHPDIKLRLQGPSAVHWLGTDDLGRDTLSRLIFGARTALLASFQSVSFGAVVGITTGLVVGYLGGWFDRIAMRVADVMQSIPAVLLALALIGVLGKGLGNAMLAVGVIFSVSFMRITRAVVLAEKEQLYVDAARVLGLRTLSIMLRQILPNISPPLIVQASIALGTALLIEAMLSFLGVGIDSTQVSWGAMLETARQFQSQQPLLPIFPGLAITLSVLAFNLLGDSLRDATLPTGATAESSISRRTVAPFAVSPTSVHRPEAPADALLAVSGLTVAAPRPGGGSAELLSDVSFHVMRGETLGLVGESGCGKSMTALAVMGLLPPAVSIAAGSIRLAGTELAGLDDDAMRQVRGRRVGMVFQEPMAALSPVHTVGRQISDAVRAHTGLGRRQALARAAELLALVGVPDPHRRLQDYPHQFSGGMAQRVVIAGALACEPELLIADEPTTALDVTIQAQVLDLLMDLRQRLSMSVLLITHDLGVVADACDRLAVMYGGEVVETGNVEATFSHPRHPYTAALLAAMPRGEGVGSRLATIPGRVPPAWAWPQGCRFHPRCAHAVAACRQEPNILRHGVRCRRADELTLTDAR
ncbi:dipeptide/oligopeptide/nickel ABC transporter permease/ATP-binding protein [Reyranella sp. CPCC 100927]|uniref:dipeptide/oligopeptide/nickel ABC transporter permease/ATP-binding protein n=1 Tax=Reyranella sp. CPCC 100927 TaxID=2599616 RepID=UPI0011B7EC7A|nr:dipeptide/oligopeptide/nickel ABC transporter permease/ATP-binding protein [Reyranella sp. CPCC 100927]TWT15405.1 dipeptide/oligopeptide/nickel ABC transporter permease/ATP-binding protein [Reyranella sp. CPCC 100927]